MLVYNHVASVAEKMADSDEEHERSRSRDKFRKERSDYGDKSRSRGDYRDRRTWREDHEVLYHNSYTCYMKTMYMGTLHQYTDGFGMQQTR